MSSMEEVVMEQQRTQSEVCSEQLCQQILRERNSLMEKLREREKIIKELIEIFSVFYGLDYQTFEFFKSMFSDSMLWLRLRFLPDSIPREKLSGSESRPVRAFTEEFSRELMKIMRPDPTHLAPGGSKSKQFTGPVMESIMAPDPSPVVTLGTTCATAIKREDVELMKPNPSPVVTLATTCATAIKREDVELMKPNPSPVFTLATTTAKAIKREDMELMKPDPSPIMPLNTSTVSESRIRRSAMILTTGAEAGEAA